MNSYYNAGNIKLVSQLSCRTNTQSIQHIKHSDVTMKKTEALEDDIIDDDGNNVIYETVTNYNYKTDEVFEMSTCQAYAGYTLK